MTRPKTPAALKAVGGVQAVVRRAALEPQLDEVEYWETILTKYKRLPDITSEERHIVDAQLSECQKIIEHLEKEVAVTDETRAKRERTRLRVQKHRRSKKSKSSYNHQLKDGADDDEEFDKYLDRIAAIQRLETK